MKSIEEIIKILSDDIGKELHIERNNHNNNVFICVSNHKFLNPTILSIYKSTNFISTSYSANLELHPAACPRCNLDPDTFFNDCFDNSKYEVDETASRLDHGDWSMSHIPANAKGYYIRLDLTDDQKLEFEMLYFS